MLRGAFGIQMIDGFGKRMIDVLNRGKSAAKKRSTEIDRASQADIIAEAPSLVIWQVGTNAVFRNNVPEYDVR